MSAILYKPEEPKKNTSGSLSNRDKVGTITTAIGTGENAKNSLIYICIKWSFVSAGVLCLFVTANNWSFRVNEKVPNVVEDYRIIAGIFLPLITLALGYAFGKGQK
jgi:hypothetical protein